MKIIIEKFAHAETYTNHFWPYLIEMIREETLEIETKYLFNDQFNTAPISKDRFEKLWNKLLKNHNFSSDYKIIVYNHLKKSMCETGLRIMESQVYKVIGDVRINKYKCYYCGHIDNFNSYFYKNISFGAICPKCNKTGYIKLLESLHKRRYKKQLDNEQNKSIHTFYCYHCNRIKSYKSNSIAGYANFQGEKYCFDCCSVIDRNYMIDNGKITLYLTLNENYRKCLNKYKPGFFNMLNSGYISNWPNTLKFNCNIQFRRHGHNWGLNRYDVWFKGPDGFLWHGVSYGENTQLVHCKRTKIRNNK